MDWKRHPEDRWTYYQEETFNGYVYRVSISVYEWKKSTKFWVAASSGKKRKEKDIFEEKENKSLGGMKALLWIKNKMFEFPKWYNSTDENQYILVHWADSRRRDIYQRLIKEGFQFMVDDGRKILMKKL